MEPVAAPLRDPDDLRAVGRVGELALTYARHGRETVLAHSRCSSPWHLSPTIRLDDTGCAYQPLLNPSGGLVGGDRLSARAVCGPGTHVLLSTPSANRVYRSLGEPSVLTVDLRVEAGAVLEWVPDVTIPYAGSRFLQRIAVRLAPGATCLLWDALASGRIARGERWAFASWENEIRILTDSCGSVLERSHVEPEGCPDAVGLAAEWDYVGSLYVIGEAVGADVWKDLAGRLRAILDARPGLALGGVSEPAVPGLAVKLLARTAPDLQDLLGALWGAIRSHLWGLSPPLLRKY